MPTATATPLSKTWPPCGIRDNDGFEAVVLDVVVEAEIAFAQHHAGSVDQGRSCRPHRRVIDGIDNDLQAQLDDVAIALVDRHLDGREAAIVVGGPVAGTHVHGVRVLHAEQRRILRRFRIVRQQNREILDIQFALHRVAGLDQQVADIEILVDVFTDGDRGRQL